MNRIVLRSALALLLCVPGAALLAQPAAQPSAPAQPWPAQPFQAVHLLWVDVQQPHAEERVVAAIAGLNEAIRKAGCDACIYRLWRVSEGSPGSYNYMQQSDWPSRAVYDSVHSSPGYVAASQAWAALRSVVKQEVYVRQSQVAVESHPGVMAVQAIGSSQAALYPPESTILQASPSR